MSNKFPHKPPNPFEQLLHWLGKQQNLSPLQLLQQAREQNIPHPELIAAQVESALLAQQKWPTLAAYQGVVLPPKQQLEQTSSEATARYKASLFTSAAAADLTGGTGIDSYYLSKRASNFTYVEQDELLATIAAHNFKVWGADIDVKATTAEQYLATTDSLPELIYLDPARRDRQQRYLNLENYSPNLQELWPQLQQRAQRVLVKLSPMTDLTAAEKALPGVVAAHVVSWKGEVRELLLLADFRIEVSEVKRTAVSIEQNAVAVATAPPFTFNTFSFTAAEEAEAQSTFSLPQKYVYLPDPALSKAGALKLAATRHQLLKLHRNTHVYTSNTYQNSFLGRCFEVRQVIPINKKALKSAKAQQGTLLLRNMPGSYHQLKKKLGFSEGSGPTLLACTLHTEEKKLLVLEPLANRT